MQERHIGRVSAIYGQRRVAAIEDCIGGQRHLWDFSPLQQMATAYALGNYPAERELEYLEAATLYRAAFVDHERVSFTHSGDVVSIAAYQPNMDEDHARLHEVTAREARLLCEERLKRAS